MSDIADILGLGPKQNVDEATKILGSKVLSTVTKTPKKPKGMSREVFDLMGSETVVPSMQPNVIAPTFKNKRATVLKGKWIWDVINNSARNEHQIPLRHWVKADMHYPDYPYAKFNVKLENVSLTFEEYESKGLTDSEWSYDDTMTVLEATTRYDLRWPVVYDKISLVRERRIEEIQARYYHVQSKLQTDSKFDSGISESMAKFNLEAETNRRRQQDLLFRKTKEDEAEELRLREELRGIDAALKKYKKQAKPPASSAVKAAAGFVAATDNLKSVKGSVMTADALGPGAAAASVAAPTVVIIGSTLNPVQIPAVLGPTPGRPCLQSSRLFTTDSCSGVSKNLFRKMNAYLLEVGMPERPVPTRAVCDLVERIRRETVTLLSLHSAIAKKEKAAATATSGGSSGVVVKTEKVSKAKTATSAEAKEGEDGEVVVKPKKVYANKRKNAGQDDGTKSSTGAEQNPRKKSNNNK